MKVEILDQARDDLVEGYYFYEKQAPRLGAYFLDSLFSDIDSLMLYGGVHRVVFGFHRVLSKRFPFAIYYLMAGNVVRVYAVLDCRRNPTWTRKKLAKA
ncbi:MAG: type II toxin-antitoxin system RelE/ParE family toxin [Opitutaceae bacterium]